MKKRFSYRNQEYTIEVFEVDQNTSKKFDDHISSLVLQENPKLLIIATIGTLIEREGVTLGSGEKVTRGANTKAELKATIDSVKHDTEDLIDKSKSIKDEELIRELESMGFEQ